VSLDTLGQDREFTAEQRRFAIQTIADFTAIWEAREKENLTKDRNLRLKMMELDKEYTENLSTKLADDEEEHVKDHIHQITNPIVHQVSSKEALGTEGSVHGEDHKEVDSHSEAVNISRHLYLGMEDEQKDMYQRALRLKYQAQGLKADFFKQGFSAFGQSTVIKYPRVWQCLFYLLQAKRGEECEPNSNKLHWKNAKRQLRDSGAHLVEQLIEYNPLGPKDSQYHSYQQLNFIERNLETYY